MALSPKSLIVSGFSDPDNFDERRWKCSYCGIFNTETQNRCGGCAETYSPTESLSIGSNNVLAGLKRKRNAHFNISRPSPPSAESIRLGRAPHTPPSPSTGRELTTPTQPIDEEETQPTDTVPDSPHGVHIANNHGSPRLGLGRADAPSRKIQTSIPRYAEKITPSSITIPLLHSQHDNGYCQSHPSDVSYDDDPSPCSGCGYYADLHSKFCPVKYPDPSRKAATIQRELNHIQSELSSARDKTISYLSTVSAAPTGRPAEDSGSSSLHRQYDRSIQDQVGSSSSGTAPGRVPSHSCHSYPSLETEYKECSLCGLRWTVSWVLRNSEAHGELLALRRKVRAGYCPQCRSDNVVGRTRFYYEFGSPFDQNWFDTDGYRSKFSASRDDASAQTGELSSLVEAADSLGSDEDMEYDIVSDQSSPGISDSDSELDQPERKARKTFQGRAAVHMGTPELGEIVSDTVDEFALEHILHSN